MVLSNTVCVAEVSQNGPRYPDVTQETVCNILIQKEHTVKSVFDQFAVESVKITTICFNYLSFIVLILAAIIRIPH